MQLIVSLDRSRRLTKKLYNANYSLPERIVIKAKAKMAPANTVNLGWRMAIIAAMKKVLSPISDTRMTERAAANACTKPRFSVGSSVPAVPLTKSVFCKQMK